MKHPSIGIVGIGWIGSQFKRYFEELRGHKRGTDLFLFDVDPKKGYADDLNRADIIFVCLPTPRNPKDGSCDTSIVAGAIAKIGGEKTIIIKSTVPPGTTEGLQKKHPRHKLLFSPEFLTESRAWENMIHPDRQIVGFTEKSKSVAGSVLALLPQAQFMSPHGNIEITATEAELIKYGGNVFLARKVNFANAFANVAQKLGADYENIRIGMSADSRIGSSHLDVLHGGYRGFGGYCFPKDLDAFIAACKEKGMDSVVGLFMADRQFNEDLLAGQGLTLEEVSVHLDVLEHKFGLKKKITS